jgi:NADH-quinone oxidoreductase subunit M
MHWLVLIILHGQVSLWIAAFYMLISHAIISSSFFLLIDAVTRRFKTRLITEISGLVWLVPNLYLIILLFLVTFLGFPGSILFISEILFFLFFFDINFNITLILLVLIYLINAICFFKNWFLLLFHYSYYYSTVKLVNDLDLKEMSLFFILLIFLYWLGFGSQFIL